MGNPKGDPLLWPTGRPGAQLGKPASIDRRNGRDRDDHTWGEVPPVAQGQTRNLAWHRGETEREDKDGAKARGSEDKDGTKEDGGGPYIYK